MASNYYIAMYNPPWAGPVAYPIDGIADDFFLGQNLENVRPGASYVLRVDEQAKNTLDFPPLDYFTCSDMTVFVSDRMQQSLTRLGVDNIQYFDVDVTYEPSGEKVACKAANIVGMINAMDREASEYKLVCGDIISRVRKLVLNEEAISHFKLFRFREFTTLLIVSADVKEKIEEQGLTGMYFVKPEEWQNSMR